MSAGAEMPLHELDTADPAIFAAGYPHESWRRLREESPVHFFENAVIPYWAVTRHSDIARVSRNPTLFSSEKELMVIPLQPSEVGRPPELIEMDPPRHRVYRRMISARFTPRAIERMHDLIGGIVSEVVENLVSNGDGECDFVEAVAARVPGRVVAWLLGVPESDWNQISDWANNISSLLGESRQQQIDEQDEYFTRLIEERRRRPKEDLISLLTQATEEDGQKLGLREILGWIDILITGGQETTRNASSGGLLAMIEHPDERLRLQADPSLLKPAVEEVLRWTSPVVHFARAATADTELGGQRIRKGDVVGLFYPSANRDEDVFDDPYRFRIDRTPNRHIAFGVGEHVCPGAHLARLELRSLFGALLPRLEELELAGPVEHYPNHVVSGVKRLPLKFRIRRA